MRADAKNKKHPAKTTLSQGRTADPPGLGLRQPSGALGSANTRSLCVKLPTANASPFPDFFILNLCCPLPTVNLLFKFQHFLLRPPLPEPRALPNKTAAETHSKNGRAGNPLHAAVCHVASLVGSLIRCLSPARYQTRQQRQPVPLLHEGEGRDEGGR